MVGPVRQAPAHPLGRGDEGAVADGLRVGGWSIYGRIKSKERAQLGHAKSDKLVYCHEALHLKEKAQHAGYKALVEKWDTDSDSSDGSDDELDLAV